MLRLTDQVMEFLKLPISHAKAAIVVGCSADTVAKYRRIFNLDVSPFKFKLSVKSKRYLEMKKRRHPLAYKLTPESRNLMKSDLSTVRVANILGISQLTVRRHRIKLNVVLIPQIKMTAEKIQILVDSTQKASVLAEKLGVTKRTIQIYRKKYNITVVNNTKVNA